MVKKGNRTGQLRKTDHGRGFERTKKQWENSISDHVGKIIDNIDANQVMKFAAWAAGAYLIWDTAKKAREIPVIQAAGTIASWVETFFLGAPLAPPPAEMTEADKMKADFEWALAAMVGSYVMVEHGGDVIKSLLP